MRTVTNVCRSCGRSNVPDDEYLPAMSLCGDCVASQMNPMQDQINRLEQSGTRNTPPGRESSPPEGCVLVEGGSFQMGSPASEKDRFDDEGPVHSVTISSFYMKITPVTQREWRELMGDNPSRFKGDDLPVEQVSWFDAVEYCNALSRSAGRNPVYRMSGDTALANWSADGFRLPTEAEWEYAARGGVLSEGYRYSGSNNVDAVGWYNGNSSSTIHPVGRKRPNELGLYDMSGNVWEWCWDWYESYRFAGQINPIGPSSGSTRVLRGGSWYDNSRFLRVADRLDNSPGGSDSNGGFRLALPAD